MHCWCAFIILNLAKCSQNPPSVQFSGSSSWRERRLQRPVRAPCLALGLSPSVEFQPRHLI